MCVPCKLHHFGNEGHTIADGDNGIAMVWQVEVQESKDQPQQLGKKWDEMDATVGLMVCMTEPIHQTGKIVTHDSGFCVAKGAMIKKQGRY